MLGVWILGDGRVGSLEGEKGSEKLELRWHGSGELKFSRNLQKLFFFETLDFFYMLYI